jgi:hypothetical protein
MKLTTNNEISLAKYEVSLFQLSFKIGKDKKEKKQNAAATLPAGQRLPSTTEESSNGQPSGPAPQEVINSMTVQEVIDKFERMLVSIF